MESIITKETVPSTSLSYTRIVCPVCQKQYSQYTCPRCNSRYCSLKCYKKHNICCTESFMRDNVLEEMPLIQPEHETKQKMLDVLKRFHSEEEVDYDQEDSLLSEEIKNNILSGYSVRLEDLSPEAIKHFHKAITCGELSKMIEPWEPWWLKPSAKAIHLSQDGTPLISLVEEHVPEQSARSTSGSTSSEAPSGPETPLPPLGKLSRTQPSPQLPVHLVDILYSYCFTLRFYNGDWQCDPSGAAMVALDISSVLGEGSQPETVSEALNCCLEITCSPIYKHVGGIYFGLNLVDDVVAMLSLGTNALICSITELRRVVLAGEKMLKSENIGKTKQVETRSRLKKADRKLFYLLCWVHVQPFEVWSCTGSNVKKQKSLLMAVDPGLEERRRGAALEPQSKVLIEEV